MKLRCPHCGNTLVPKKERKHFIIHKCINPKCPYYLYNLKKVDQEDLRQDYGKNKYKLHYIYREFTMDFFSMDLNTLPKNASSLKFSKHNAHVMSLCLPLHVNFGLSLRKTSGEDGFGQRPKPSKSFSESIYTVFKVHLSLFFAAQFFIDYLTLPIKLLIFTKRIVYK